MGGDQKFRFWEDPWTADELSLMEKYPRMYRISCQQKQLMMQMGSSMNNGWEWKLTWRRSFFYAEVEMADIFLGEISQQQVDSYREDTWIWKPNTYRYYSTKSGYNFIWGETTRASLNFDFQELWKLKIPAKAAVFVWRLIRDRLPTKKNLSRRQVVMNDVLYSSEIDFVMHFNQ